MYRFSLWVCRLLANDPSQLTYIKTNVDSRRCIGLVCRRCKGLVCGFVDYELTYSQLTYIQTNVDSERLQAFLGLVCRRCIALVCRLLAN
jgi:hypothetical protein